METMVPLGLVIGWIFAVLGTLALGFCCASLMIEADMEGNEAKKFMWAFAIVYTILVAGVVLVTKYWIGGA